MRSIWIVSALLLAATPSFAMIKQKKTDENAPENLCVFDTRWSGFAVGFSMGGIANTSDGVARPTGNFSLPVNLADNPQRTDSFDIGGGAYTMGAQVGGNYQMKIIVLGAETDFQYSTLSKKHHFSKTLSSPLSGTFNDHVTERVNWFGTLRPRFGLAFKPVLIYATGGLAYGHVSSKTGVSFSPVGDQYSGKEAGWKIGYTAGGGLEWAFTRHWSLKFECLFVDLRKTRYHDANEPPPTNAGFAYKTRLETEFYVARFGFNYTI